MPKHTPTDTFLAVILGVVIGSILVSAIYAFFKIVILRPSPSQLRLWRRLILNAVNIKGGLTGRELAVRLPGIKERWLRELLETMTPMWLSSEPLRSNFSAFREPEAIPYVELRYQLTDSGRAALEDDVTRQLLAGKGETYNHVARIQPDSGALGGTDGS